MLVLQMHSICSRRCVSPHYCHSGNRHCSLIFHSQQAESELSDQTKREELDAVINQARVILLKERQLPTSIPDDDFRLKSLTPPWKEQLRAKSKELLIDEEVRRRKYASSVSPFCDSRCLVTELLSLGMVGLSR